MRNFAEILEQRARLTPDGIAYRFFHGPVLQPDILTFHALWQHAAALAVHLQDAGLQGQRLMLACKSQRLFVVGFYACLLAGCTAVPTALPRRKTLAGRMALLSRDAAIGGLITDSDMIDPAALLPGQPLTMVDLAQWEMRADLAERWRLPCLADDAAAFIQYTSGSTADPKGVVVTHHNLMSNCAAIAQGMGFTAASSILTALPLFHDMGLVGGVLESMYAGCIGNCMPPSEFVQYPERWLQIISAFHITISGGPNFMYQLAAQHVTAEHMRGCDLSAWQVAFCGAEPIRPDTIADFTQQFAGAGFRPEAFYPCYGLAEATLFVTGKPLGASPRTADGVVDCGVACHDTRLTIVDPATRCEVADGEVGEIWIEGSSAAAGYWGQPAASEQVFGATLAAGGSRRFLRSGDLGCLRDGHLYVTGRLKDLIIVYGKKYAPHELESDAESSHDALRPSGAAAVSLLDERGERVLLVCELKREWLRQQAQWASVVAAVTRNVSLVHGVTIDEVVLIKPGTLPRTSSGKVRRQQCKLDFLAGSLERAGSISE